MDPETQGAGRLEMFEYNDAKELWEPLGSPIDGTVFQFFGRPVALAGKALRVASGSASSLTDINVFEYDRHVKDWVEMSDPIETKMSNDFGMGLALSEYGDIVAFGQPEGNNDTQLVRVLHYDRSSRQWMPLGKDIVGDTIGGDRFGMGVRLSANGKILAAGSQNAENGKGKVQVYRYSRKYGDWFPMGSPVIGTEDSAIGNDISLNAEGTVLAVAFPQGEGDEESGATLGNGLVRVYYFDNDYYHDWVQVGSDIVNTMVGAGFDGAMDLNAVGDVIAIGSPWYETVGMVNVYQYTLSKDGGDWVQLGQNADLLGDAHGDGAGSATAVDARGTQVALGIGGNDVTCNGCGAVQIWEWKNLSEGKKKKKEKDDTSGKKDSDAKGKKEKKGKGKKDDHGKKESDKDYHS